MKYFAGIGSRETPMGICIMMSYLAKELTQNGYTLRSGNAEGADQAFASGVKDNKAQIWLPWKEFNMDFQRLHPDHIYILDTLSDIEAYESVEKFHPYFKEMIQKPSEVFIKFTQFMSRNYRQVRGLDEPDSEFIICWTPNGEMKGGTAQAMRIANHYHIPVFNLWNMSTVEVLKEIEKLNLLS